MGAFRFSDRTARHAALRAEMVAPDSGGYASFEGWVRNHNEGRAVLHLEYEAYEALGVAEGERIVAEAVERFGVERAACVHRVGDLAIGELAVWVGVTARHRDEAFRRLPVHHRRGEAPGADLEEGALRGRRLRVGRLRAPRHGRGAPVTLVERPLTDSFGRIHRDLRISVTDRCNFRCTYCMPEEGLPWLPRSEVLTFEEIEQLARLLVTRHGIESIRLTGGEPTVRAHLPVLVRMLAALPVDLSLTTNGATLATLADELAEAGLHRVNVSLDSLRPERFAELTRRDELASVLAGIDAALRAGLGPVKVNVVVLRGVNDDELVDLARYGRDRGVQLRFIEFMPLDASGGWHRDQVVSQAEIVDTISAVFPLVPADRARGSEPAGRFRYLDGAGEIGVIPSVTAALLRIVRPAPPHRRRPAAQLPVQPGRPRPARPAPPGRVGRRPLRRRSRPASPRRRRATPSTRCSFVRPNRSMSQIGG